VNGISGAARLARTLDQRPLGAKDMVRKGRFWSNRDSLCGSERIGLKLPDTTSGESRCADLDPQPKKEELLR
jgi:hypothetical protein